MHRVKVEVIGNSVPADAVLQQSYVRPVHALVGFNHFGVCNGCCNTMSSGRYNSVSSLLKSLNYQNTPVCFSIGQVVRTAPILHTTVIKFLFLKFDARLPLEVLHASLDVIFFALSVLIPLFPGSLLA